MTKLLTFTFILAILVACNSQKTSEKYRTDYDGLVIEKFDSTFTKKSTQKNNSYIPAYMSFDDNRFNQDNKIYKVGRKFVFKYHYIDKKGDTLLYTRGKLNSENYYGWQFEREDKVDSNSCVSISMTINSGLKPFINQSPDYCQTVFINEYILRNGESLGNEMSRIIENPKNVWMHPPRNDFFKILEINPFPYIKFPYEIGNKWTWKLEFGDHWADKRWLLWTGNNENKYNYEITDKIKLKTHLGILDCFVTDGQAISSLGRTYLRSYFSEEFGFVRLDYTNIDGTKTIIELDDVK